MSPVTRTMPNPVNIFGDIEVRVTAFDAESVDIGFYNAENGALKFERLFDVENAKALSLAIDAALVQVAELADTRSPAIRQIDEAIAGTDVFGMTLVRSALVALRQRVLDAEAAAT